MMLYLLIRYFLQHDPLDLLKRLGYPKKNEAYTLEVHILELTSYLACLIGLGYHSLCWS